MTTGPLLDVNRDAIVQIMRNVTGRLDVNDPAFTNEIMIDYLNGFLLEEHPQEMQMFSNRTWWDFQIDDSNVDPIPVSLDFLGYSSIGPLAYISYLPNSQGTQNTFKMFWYEDPADFYAKWPWDMEFTPQMPTYVLYYNNELTFRGPPDREYNVRISAYKIDNSFVGGTTNTNQSSSVLSYLGQQTQYTENTRPLTYLKRYLAYGASLDILSDYGEMDKYNEVFQVYRRYRAQVTARTWNQLSSQRTNPDF